MNRQTLPDTRRSLTHRVVIESEQGPVSVFLTAGFYDDGPLGEVFIQIGKQGSTMRGLTDNFARLVSYALQYGIPLAELAERFRGANYPPQGATNNAAIPACTSIVDYLFRWLEQIPKSHGKEVMSMERDPNATEEAETNPQPEEPAAETPSTEATATEAPAPQTSDAPPTPTE